MRPGAPDNRLQETNHLLVEVRSYITLIRLIGDTTGRNPPASNVRTTPGRTSTISPTNPLPE